jgi:predicted nucleotidyltransferase
LQRGRGPFLQERSAFSLYLVRKDGQWVATPAAPSRSAEPGRSGQPWATMALCIGQARPRSPFRRGTCTAARTSPCALSTSTRAIAWEFDPEKIILFGCYAYGTPHEDSDVDLLVVMPARNQHDQAVRIRWRLAAPFPIDLILRTPQQLAWRLAERDSFLTGIVSQRKVLYEKDDQGMGQEGRAGSALA